jgi:FkbM family methyltransferase
MPLRVARAFMDPRIIKINGRTVRIADDQPAFWDKVERGAWEPETFAFIDRHVDGSTVFLDCGAWIGATSLYAAARAGRVVAVEADPVALAQLRRNLAANPELAARVDVVANALHLAAGSVRMGSRRKPGDSMSSVLLGKSRCSWDAEAITPGALAAMLPLGQPLVVKIDLEGAEYALLPHLGPILDRAAAVHLSLHPAALVEALGRARAAEASRRALKALNAFDGAPPLDGLPGGEWQLTRPPRSRACLPP